MTDDGSSMERRLAADVAERPGRRAPTLERAAAHLCPRGVEDQPGRGALCCAVAPARRVARRVPAR